MDCFWQDTLFRYRRYVFRVGLDISWMFVPAVESSRSATQNKVSMSDPIRMICWVFFNSSREKREDSICYHPIRSHLLYLPAALHLVQYLKSNPGKYLLPLCDWLKGKSKSVAILRWQVFSVCTSGHFDVIGWYFYIFYRQVARAGSTMHCLYIGSFKSLALFQKVPKKRYTIRRHLNCHTNAALWLVGIFF